MGPWVLVPDAFCKKGEFSRMERRMGKTLSIDSCSVDMAEIGGVCRYAAAECERKLKVGRWCGQVQAKECRLSETMVRGCKSNPRAKRATWRVEVGFSREMRMIRRNKTDADTWGHRQPGLLSDHDQVQV